MALPTLHRVFIKAAGADADFAGAQVAPEAALLWPTLGTSSIVVTCVIRKADGTIATGTVDLQMVGVATPVQPPGVTLAPLFTGFPAQLLIGTGTALAMNTGGFPQVVIRVVNIAALAADAVRVDIFITSVS